MNNIHKKLLLSHFCLKDCTLSWSAKGLYSYILDLPKDKVTLKELEEYTSTDILEDRQLANILEELVKQGYLKQRNKNGKVEYRINEMPPLLKEACRLLRKTVK